MAAGRSKEQVRRRWTVPVAYGGDNGMDLDWLAQRLDTTTDEIVARHKARPNTVST